MKQYVNWKTALMGIVTAFLLTVLSFAAYGSYCANLDEQRGPDGSYQIDVGESEWNGAATPSTEILKGLHAFQLVLYKELCATKLSQEGQDSYLRYQDLFFEQTPELEVPEAFADNKELYQGEYATVVESIKNTVANYLSGVENDEFAAFNGSYDYWVIGTGEKEGVFLTNTEIKDLSKINPNAYAYLFQVDFDAYGAPEIVYERLVASDRETLRKNLNTLLHSNYASFLGAGEYLRNLDSAFFRNAVARAAQFKGPSSCSMILGITRLKYREVYGSLEFRDEWYYYYARFGRIAIKVFCVGMLLLSAVAGALYLNSRSESKRKVRVLARAPLELLAFLVLFLYYNVWDDVHHWMTALYVGTQSNYVSAFLYVLFFMFLIAWYLGGCLGEARTLGLRAYVVKRSLTIRILGMFKRFLLKLHRDYTDIHLDVDLRKKVLHLVILHGILISLCCAGWFLGIFGIVIYCVCMYFWIMKYIVRVQKGYQKLQRMTEEMAAGNLKYEPQESLEIFEPLKEHLVSIRDGFDKAVQEEVKSHKMKTELITNVSHDLKTPLTAIITYVNLLKDENLTPEQQKQYVDTLDKKSLRLKRLIEDLFEVSKANSGNVQLNLRDCDLAKLIKQIFYEVEDKLEERKLITRLTIPDEKVILRLDGDKTYRIYENLFNNVAKYAMSGTRVYVTLTEEADRVTVVMKNITEAELYVPAEELTERFVRGDASRGTVEGSGLGLAIVRSFTELQGGKLEIDVDGDLFKVTTVWRKFGMESLDQADGK